MSIRRQLVSILLAIALIPLLIFILVGTLSSSKLAQNQQKAKLEAVRTLKASEISLYFNTIETNVKSLAELPVVKESMTGLGGIVHELDKKGVRGTALLNDPTYMQEHNKVHAVFEKLKTNYGYYDIFFICKHGDAYYTVTKEPDFGTNMNKEKTGLAESWEHAMKGETYLTTIEHYAPSNDVPAMFLSTPVVESGKTLGVFVVQLPLSQINQIMQKAAGMGKSGEAYILSSAEHDYEFYSESRFIEDGSLDKYLIDPTKKSSILNLRNPSKTAKLANEGKTGVAFCKDYRGITVLSAYQPLKIANQTVILLSEIDKSEAMAETNRMMLVFIILAIVFTITIIFISRVFGKKISSPIELIATEQIKVSQEIQELAKVNAILASGDWTISPKATDIQKIGEKLQAGKMRKDEIGDLYRSTSELVKNSDHMKEAMLEMIDSVSGSLIEISEITEQVASEAAQMNESSLHLSSAATEQAATVEQINSTTDEILHNARENLKNATLAQDQGHATSKEASTGQENMQNLIAAMNEIQSSSEEIEKIVKVIDDIAFQTNLLALNAAVEAARAGSHGKGFAVVADEVRSLAGRSAKAAKEITQIITQNNSKIESGNEITETTATAFSAIINRINETIESIDKVTTSSNEQTIAITEISSALEDVNDSVQSVSATSEENASAGELLAHQSDRLDKVVQSFTIDTKRKLVTTSKKPVTRSSSKAPAIESMPKTKDYHSTASTTKATPVTPKREVKPITTTPITKPKAMPTTKPKAMPTTKPKAIPTTKPKAMPTTKPTMQPTTKPKVEQKSIPTPHIHTDDDHHDFDSKDWGKY